MNLSQIYFEYLAEDRQTTSSVVTMSTMKTSTTGETFLSNKNKISGVQDVLTRMKNENYVEGDTEEDIAARGLLNKFIGKSKKLLNNIVILVRLNQFR